VADALIEHGFSAVAINGDIPQKQREHTIEQLKSGKLDVLVATDVAARGLDVQRISHVINYDLPHDSEAWIHRIGRTGRAGRQGEAILFLTPHERRHLRGIERDTRQPIAEMQFPSVAAVNARRKAGLKAQIAAAMTAPQMPVFRQVLAEYQRESGAAPEEIAAAVAVLMQGDRPFLLEEPRRPERLVERPRREEPQSTRGRDRRERPPARGIHRTAAIGPAEAEPMVFEHRSPKHPPGPALPESESTPTPRTGPRPEDSDRPARALSASRETSDARPRPRRPAGHSEPGMETFRVEVGNDHGVKPGNIVGAIANEAGLDSRNIGRIDIREDHSFVDLPQGMPMDIFRGLKDVVVLGRHLRISRATGGQPAPRRPPYNQGRPSTSRPQGTSQPRHKAAGGKPRHGARTRPGQR
jgi:ATP-dependent RNA helicase DeaD